MNSISDNKFLNAMELFCNGASIRQVMKLVGISRETAHRIQKAERKTDIEISGKTKVLTGRKKDGSFSYYETSTIQPQWEK